MCVWWMQRDATTRRPAMRALRLAGQCRGTCCCCRWWWCFGREGDWARRAGGRAEVVSCVSAGCKNGERQSRADRGISPSSKNHSTGLWETRPTLRVAGSVSSFPSVDTRRMPIRIHACRLPLVKLFGNVGKGGLDVRVGRGRCFKTGQAQVCSEARRFVARHLGAGNSVVAKVRLVAHEAAN